MVDTQFIFGLRKSDKHHEKCIFILNNYSNKLCYSSISLIEVTVVMMNQKKKFSEIEEFISTIKQIFMIHDISEIMFEGETIIRSLILRNQNSKLRFFDSIILAVAESNAVTVLGDDWIFSEFSSIESITLNNFIDKFQNNVKQN